MKMGKFETEINYIWMLIVGFVLVLITLYFFRMNGVNLYETEKFLFYTLQIIYLYPFFQLMRYKINRLRELLK